SRVCHAVAFENVEILVDDEKVLFSNLVKSEPQTLRVESAWLVCAGRDLPSKAGVVARVIERTACQRYLLASSPGTLLNMCFHPLVGAIHQRGLCVVHGGGHVVSPLNVASRTHC